MITDKISFAARAVVAFLLFTTINAVWCLPSASLSPHGCLRRARQ